MHLTKKFVGLKSKNTSYILWTKLGNYGHSGEEGVESSAAPIPLAQNISWDDAGPGRKLEKKGWYFSRTFLSIPSNYIRNLLFIYFFTYQHPSFHEKKNR